MPLSEEELRLLEQMERALAEEDPKFVSTIQGTTIERAAKVRALAAGGVFLVGVIALLGGAVAQQIWLGVLGFIVMLTAAVVGLTAWRGRVADTSGPRDPFEHGFGEGGDEDGFRLIQGGRRDKPARKPKAPRAQGSFMQRMEQRWQQRRQRGGY